jgi:ribosome-associated protein
MQLQIETEYIKLDSFLKAVSAVASGGEAKVLILEGMVRVNGEVERRRGRKLHSGDRIECHGESYEVEGTAR